MRRLKMNEVTSSVTSVGCDACNKKFNDTKFLIGVFCQDMDSGVVVGGKKRVYLCPECFSKLDKSPTGMGVVSEDGMTPLGMNIK